MYTYLLILRILHVLCGVFWAGTAFLMVLYVFPAVKKAGPDGGKILQAITGTNKFPQVIALASAITVASGLLLMWYLSNGFMLAWFESRYGMSLAIGGVAAIIAFLQVMFINMPSIKRTGNIAIQVKASGGIPSQEQQFELAKIRSKVMFSTRLIAFWLLLAVITMAAARYL